MVQISLEDPPFLTLIKLRRNISLIDLDVRFSVSHTTVSNILHTWLVVLHHILVESMLPSAPSPLDTNKASLPYCLATFSSCRMIIDCTEVQIAIPVCMDSQSFTYSHYKHRNTFKGLVGVAPNGAVVFVSRLHPGSTSDMEVVWHYEVLNNMEPGDMVLADKGFLIHDLTPASVSLNLPPFLSTPQFMIAQAKLTCHIDRARIHVEWAIQRIKIFSIASRQIPQSLPEPGRKWRNYGICDNIFQWFTAHRNHTKVMSPSLSTKQQNEELTWTW